MNEAAEHDTVLDTGAEQLGKTYARALIGAAQSAGIADKIIDQLGSVVDDCLAVSPQLRAAFASPQIDNNEKIKVIDRLFGESCDPLLVKFLKVMAGRGRVAHVDAVRAAAGTIHDEMLGRLVATVQTAVPLDDALRSKIVEQIGSIMQKHVRLSESVDPALVGGMVIRVGDRVFDSSVSNRLDTLARRTRNGFSSQLLQRFGELTSE